MTIRRNALFLVLAAVGCTAATATAQETDLQAEVEALKRGQEAMRKEIAEIKELLRARPAGDARPTGPDVAGKLFELAGNPVRGNEQARLTLIEFTDFQCGYCARHQREAFPRLMANYVDSGKLRYASLDLPLERIHKLAFKAAEAAHCAGDQGKYWEMHHRLFANQRALEPWSGHAEALELDVAAFDACLSSGRHADAVRGDMATARQAGASGTPSFVLGRTAPDDSDQVLGIEFIRGAQPYDRFAEAIDRALKGGD